MGGDVFGGEEFGRAGDGEGDEGAVVDVDDVVKEAVYVCLEGGVLGELSP